MSKRLALKYKLMADLGEGLAELSTAKIRKVGCVIFTPDCQHILGIGYNGQAPGVDHEKSEPKESKKSSGDLHAEVNALMKADMKWCADHGLVLYVSAPPCVPCAGYIIASRKIGLVVVGPQRAPQGGIELLNEMNLVVTQIGTIDAAIEDVGRIRINFVNMANKLRNRWAR